MPYRYVASNSKVTGCTPRSVVSGVPRANSTVEINMISTTDWSRLGTDAAACSRLTRR